jgi:hypothetical protein
MMRVKGSIMCKISMALGEFFGVKIWKKWMFKLGEHGYNPDTLTALIA